MFDELMKARQWIPLRNCPGRYRLTGCDPRMSIDELLGSDPVVYRHQVANARDRVLVAPLDRGGVISYERTDGTVLHTLNTPGGFSRKLDQLGISLP